MNGAGGGGYKVGGRGGFRLIVVSKEPALTSKQRGGKHESTLSGPVHRN